MKVADFIFTRMENPVFGFEGKFRTLDDQKQSHDDKAIYRNIGKFCEICPIIGIIPGTIRVANGYRTYKEADGSGVLKFRGCLLMLRGMVAISGFGCISFIIDIAKTAFDFFIIPFFRCIAVIIEKKDKCQPIEAQDIPCGVLVVSFINCCKKWFGRLFVVVIK